MGVCIYILNVLSIWKLNKSWHNPLMTISDYLFFFYFFLFLQRDIRIPRLSIHICKRIYTTFNKDIIELIYSLYNFQ